MIRFIQTKMVSLLLALAMALGVATAVAAHGGDPLEDVRFDQRLDAQVPLSLAFVDEDGRSVQLGDYLGEKPVILTLGYFECPRLCDLVYQETATALRQMDELVVGSDFQVVSVSIDATETPAAAAAKKQVFVKQAARNGAAAGWHFLTGKQAAIDQLADAVGFHYAYDPELDEFAHPSGLVMLTPNGRIARYIFGIDYPPRDVRLALVEAADNQIGSPVDQLLLLCYHYDPQTGQYTLLITNGLRWAGIGTVLVLGLLLGRTWYREIAAEDKKGKQSC